MAAVSNRGDCAWLVVFTIVSLKCPRDHSRRAHHAVRLLTTCTAPRLIRHPGITIAERVQVLPPPTQRPFPLRLQPNLMTPETFPQDGQDRLTVTSLLEQHGQVRSHEANGGGVGRDVGQKRGPRRLVRSSCHETLTLKRGVSSNPVDEGRFTPRTARTLWRRKHFRERGASIDPYTPEKVWKRSTNLLGAEHHENPDRIAAILRPR